MSKANISMLEIEELACDIIGKDYDEIDGDTNAINEALYEDLNIELDDFKKIVDRLIVRIDIGKSPLTGERYKGFSNTAAGTWLAKTKI